MTRDHIPDQVTVVDERTGEKRARTLDTSFASENWNRAIRDRGHPGMFVRRHLEACVLTYLAEELRTGDIAVAGAAAYADWADQLLSPAEVAERLPAFCAGVGIPGTAAAFRAELQDRLSSRCRATDAMYPDLADFAIDDDGRPSLKQYRAAPPTASGQALALALRDRMPERTLLGILARTGHWLEWWRRFSPASGSDPKLKDPFARYILTTFTYGTNLGPAQAARHIAGVTAHELSVTSARHVTTGKLNKAIADVVDAFTELDLIRAWGDGSVVAADGTQVETFIDNLLAETSIRYGGTGGIAYHHVSDTYIALFSKFIPVGVWEAVHIIQGLLDQQSRMKPDTIHADTQGQALPVYALAHLFGFELMPRVRNWKDLNFYRPAADTRFRHIDALFGEPGRNVIDWNLVERHFDDLMRVVLPVPVGPATAPADHRGDEQGRVLQQLLRLVPLRQRGPRPRQRPRRAGEADQVLHPADQRGHLPHHPGHDDGPAAARRRGLGDQTRGPGHPVALPDNADQPVRRLRHRRDQHHARGVRRAPARRRPGPGTRAVTGASGC